LAEPLLLDGHLHGVLAVECASATGDVSRALRWGLSGLRAALLASQLGEAMAVRENLMTLVNLLGTSLDQPEFSAAAEALSTELAMVLTCDRVSIGFRRQGVCEVAALSHATQIGERMNLIGVIGQAMDEALDQNQAISLPLPEGQVRVIRDHLALARRFGNDVLLTLPFLAAGRQGAFTFERRGSAAFSVAETDLCQNVVALLGRALELRYRAERSALERLRQELSAINEKLRHRGYYGRKFILGAGAALTLFFLVMPGEYRVNTRAVIEGAVQRALVAPFDGYIEGAAHRAGDVVKQGEVLANLDDRDLRLEYMRWFGQVEQYDKQFAQTNAQHDRGQAAIAGAQRAQAEAQMALIADQIARARISAPFDGIVISGDLSQSLGSTVKTGQELFKVSPLNEYRVDLEIDESDIDGVAVGQGGELVLKALPHSVLSIHVQQVTPVVNSKDGRSFYHVEARLDAPPEGIRPGMEGVAKVRLGQRNLFWIWTHRLFDWLRLAAWDWL
jgi:RND family efflux transporter MFP subunit